MQPIICPNCQTEVIPHETHLQRLEDCFNIVATKFSNLSEESKVKIALNFFNEINDFIISENIQKGKMETTAKIQSYKKANIQALKKEGE